MKHSDSIKEIATAFSKFQSEVTDPTKTGVNKFFEGKKYVQLDGLLESVRPALTKHGLSIMQEPGGDGQNITITTLLLHNSGEWMEFEPLTLRAVKTDPQGAGSAITYGRRYALSAILGVAWDEDDDGNNASKSQDKQKTQTNTKTPLPKENTAHAKYEGLAGDYPVNFSSYKGKLSGMPMDKLSWVAESYNGADKQLKDIAKRYLAEVADNELKEAIK